ncbi:MAG TPA: polysaccharide pyruvyl transferase family protein, partial [Clostridiales bacterium]|nr:polysaccharide pyruvyl transferase family protein [Clostridiales bacterium]
MKKIYLSAYYCMNFGDDLFVKTLIRRYPNTRFFINIDAKMRTAFRNEKNISFSSHFAFFFARVLCKLKIISRDDVEIFYVRRANAYVKIGGSIFIETPKAAKTFVEQYNRNAFFIGPNFGPYQSEAFVEQVRRRLSNVKDCCFRDHYSYKIFRDLSNVRYAPDVLFNVKTGLERKKGRYLGISVILLEKREGLSEISDEYYRTISNACAECKRMNIPVKLFAFCKREGDADAMKKILSYTDHPEEVDTCVYDGDTDLFMAQLNECRWLLATRLHSMILG